MINVQVEKSGTENNTSLIKRFTKKVQSSGVLPRVRSIRYSARLQSKYSKKKRALKSIARRSETEKLAKLGKLPEPKVRGRGRK